MRTGPERVRELMELDYSIHFHVWRPDTFLEFIVAATREANLEMEMVEFIPRQQDDDEYIFVFLKGIAPVELTIPPPAEDPVTEQLRDEVAALRAEVARLAVTADQLAAVTGSRSWKATAPLRAAVATASRLRHRGMADG